MDALTPGGVTYLNEDQFVQALRDPILTERERTHGNFKMTARVAVDIREAIFETPAELNERQREALTMIATKIARIMCGDPNCEEHWKDIAGYAKLGMEACK